jgi:hypothetical protein
VFFCVLILLQQIGRIPGQSRNEVENVNHGKKNLFFYVLVISQQIGRILDGAVVFDVDEAERGHPSNIVLDNVPREAGGRNGICFSSWKCGKEQFKKIN